MSEEIKDLSGVVVKVPGSFVYTAPAKAKVENKAEEPAKASEEPAKKEVSLDEIESISKIELSVEEQARLQGWKPKEEYKGDPNTWVEPKYFIERGVFIRKQADLSRKTRELEEQNRKLAENQAKLYEMAYRQALADIETAKREVRSSKDLDAYDKVLKAEQELKASYKPIDVPKTESVEQDEAKAYAEKVKQSMPWKKFALLNPWCEKDDPDSMFLRQEAAKFCQEQGFAEAKTDEEYDKQLTAIYKHIRTNHNAILEKMSPIRPKVMPVTGYTGNGTKSDVSFEQSIAQYPKAVQEGAMYFKRSNQLDLLEEFLRPFKK